MGKFQILSDRIGKRKDGWSPMANIEAETPANSLSAYFATTMCRNPVKEKRALQANEHRITADTPEAAEGETLYFAFRAIPATLEA